MDYRQAGVDVVAGRAFVDRIRQKVESTRRPEVLGGLGGFGGLFQLPSGYREPVLVSGTDGVGTKLKLAHQMNRHDTIGIDLVAMCVNDVLTCGAEPLFFLDYLATGQLAPEQLADVVSGVADGCQQAGCALLGGETAEMPDLYREGEYDLAGCIVGVVERSQIVNGEAIQEGDVLLGLRSTGLHTNGYSLARKVLFGKYDVHDAPEALGGDTVGAALLRQRLRLDRDAGDPGGQTSGGSVTGPDPALCEAGSRGAGGRARHPRYGPRDRRWPTREPTPLPGRSAVYIYRAK